MTAEEMSYFFNQTKGILTWDEFIKNQVNEHDDEQTCMKKIFRVLICYDNTDLTRWNYYKAIYNDIPVQYRMKVLFEELYQNADVDVPEMLNVIQSYFCNEETEELKAIRIESNKHLLKNRIRKDGTIKVFRGTAENFLLPQYSASFTLHKKVAEFFVNYHKAYHGSRFGVVHSELIGLDRIIGYSNDRKEAEVYVIPEAIINGPIIRDWRDVECLDAWNIESFEYYDKETYELVQDIIYGGCDE